MCPSGNVWGLLVDNAFDARAAAGRAVPDPGALRRHPGRRAERAGDARARPGGCGQLLDIGDEQARDDLARASVMALSFVAQSARGIGLPMVPQRRGRQGRHDRRAVHDPLARRAGPAARQGGRRLLDLGGRARHERLDLHRPGDRLDRRRRRGRLSGAVGAMSGPLHGGAPSRVLGMIEEVERTGRRRRRTSRAVLDRGERLMGFGHRVYRAEDPRARVLRRTARELGAPRYEVAQALEKAALERAAARAARTGCWRRTWSSGRRSCWTSPRCPAHMFTSMFTCARTAGWCGAHPGAEAHRPPGPAVRALRRPRPAQARRRAGWVDRHAPDPRRWRVAADSAASDCRNAPRSGHLG